MTDRPAPYADPVELLTANGERVQATLSPSGQLALVHRETVDRYAYQLALSAESTEQLRELLNARQPGKAEADPIPFAPIIGHDTLVVLIASTTGDVAPQVAANLRRHVRDALPAHVVTAGGMPL